MPMGGGRGIHNGGFRLYPGSDHFSTHSTRGKTDTRIAANSFNLSSVCQDVDLQDTILFSKPYGGLDWCPIPFETLQIQISLTHKGREMVVMHSNAFMRTLLACCLVTLYQEGGDRSCSIRLRYPIH